MNHKIFLYLVGFFLIAGIFVTITRTFAQDTGETGTTPGGGAIDQTDNIGSTGIAANDSFSILWLLPLIAIPVLLYLLWPSKRSSEDRGTHELAGVKGGRAEDVDEEYVPEPPRYRDTI